MPRAVAATYTVPFHDTVFAYDYGMAYLDG